MRFLKFSFVFLTIALLLNACSKDTNIISGDEQQEQSSDNAARLAAKKLYEDHYVASKSQTSDIAWSGDEPSCNAGSVSQSTKDKIFKRLTYFRKAVGLNNTIAENAVKSEKAQKAALMMYANGILDHFPPESWKCYSTEGKQAAGSSLLTQYKNAEAIDSYMRDYGENNGPAGHRRWLLWPKLQEIGIGNTNATNAIWVLGNAGTPPEDAPEFIAWPPKGYSPKHLAYERWSFSIASADFSVTTISMKNQNNQSVSLSIEELDTQFGDRTIVWKPSINTSAITEDTLYTVTLKNVGINDQMQEFEYEVTLFDVNN